MIKKMTLIGILLLMFSLVSVPMLMAAGEKEAGAAKKVEPATIEIVGHRVHKKIATEGVGGDFAASWIEKTEDVAGVNWNTLEIGPLHDRLFREASLPSTNVSVSYLLNTYALPRVANLLEPLDDYLAKMPIDSFKDEFPQGMVASLTFNGKIYGIPMRAAPNALWWNESIFKEAGLSKPPTTPEEFVAFAKKCTFKRADGTQVYGYIAQSHYYYTGVGAMARMWDGDFIDVDYRVVCNQPAMVKAVSILRDFYKEGVIPQNVASIQHAEKQRMAEQCIIAMGFDAPGKADSYNAAAVCPTIKVAINPMSAEMRAKYGDFPPATSEYWSFVIPKNSKYKNQGWEFIRALSTHEGALAMALNGNNPLRMSVFKDAKFTAAVPFAAVAAGVAKNARVPLPAFDKSPQAMEMIDTYIEKAMFGELAPQAAMDELAKKLKELSTMLK